MHELGKVRRRRVLGVCMGYGMPLLSPIAVSTAGTNEKRPRPKDQESTKQNKKRLDSRRGEPIEMDVCPNIRSCVKS